jgi:hypothetical protein
MKQTFKSTGSSFQKMMLTTVLFMFVTGIAFAQTTQTPPANKTTIQKQTSKVQKTEAGKTKVDSKEKGVTQTDPSHQTSTTTKSKSSTISKTNAATLKKDGTPDKRFKENKTGGNNTTTTNTHIKKDGTPDKRYKENKKG